MLPKSKEWKDALEFNKTGIILLKSNNTFLEDNIQLHTGIHIITYCSN